MERLKVGFDDSFRRRLVEAAKKSGSVSLAEELRVRVMQTFQADRMPEPDKVLLSAVANLMDLVERQTGWPWFQHPLAHDVLRHAIATLLDRMQPPDEPAGNPPHQPVPLVASKDPKAIGMALETLAFSSPDVQRYRRDALAGLNDTTQTRRPFDLRETSRKIRGREKGRS
jgi:hypothetical protein